MSANEMVQQSERQWYIVGRWQEFEGEGRANLLRIVSVGAFYVVQLIQRYWLFDDDAKSAASFHAAATAIAVAWSVLAMAVLLCLRSRVFPAWLKYISTTCDLVLLTALATIANKADSPLVYVFFMIIVLAGLRFSLPLVWFATVGSMLGFMVLVAVTDRQWFDANHEVAVHVQLITLLSLVMAGILVGQILRRTRGMANEFAERLTTSESTKES